MKALLWKDLRVNLSVEIAGLFLFVIPYVFVAVILRLQHWPASPPFRAWGESLLGASLMSLAVSQLAIAALGANAIASERADRSAEFLFSLPASRWRIVASKFLLALGLTLALWVAHLVIAGGVSLVFPDTPFSRDTDIWTTRRIIGSTGILLFGATWLGSSFLSSPTHALAVGFALFATVGLGMFYSSWYLHWPPANYVATHWYEGICLTLGILTFSIGTAYYLRRVEP